NCWDWIRQLCVIGGVQPPRRTISYKTAYRIGAVLESVYRLGRRTQEPPMTRFVAAQLAKDHYFDISAAKERLGYRVRISMQEGLDSLRESFKRSAANSAESR
ncbi:MAG: 3-beta hydroxysteroid dehydrogenase, partial [Novipirellula sp. JB048]